MNTVPPKPQDKKIKKHFWILVAIVCGMFVFCYALVPFYNVLCKVSGFNGKVETIAANTKEIAKFKIDKNRTVMVELMTTLNEQMPVEFTSEKPSISLHPGQIVRTSYTVKNLTNKPIIVQAIPNVMPGLAAQHIRKLECFCFQKQPLGPLEEKIMPLVFTLDPILPEKFGTVALSYTLFDITES
jgi:cytochrome c oxidase assembly protein subunit 11